MPCSPLQAGCLRFAGADRTTRSRNSWISRMFDDAAARRHMVDGQIRTADVTNPRLIAAMQTVPRELFVAPAMTAQAYRDGDVSLGEGRALVRPIVLGKLIQGSDVRPGG